MGGNETRVIIYDVHGMQEIPCDLPRAKIRKDNATTGGHQPYGIIMETKLGKKYNEQKGKSLFIYVKGRN